MEEWEIHSRILVKPPPASRLTTYIYNVPARVRPHPHSHPRTRASRVYPAPHPHMITASSAATSAPEDVVFRITVRFAFRAHRHLENHSISRDLAIS